MCYSKIVFNRKTLLKGLREVKKGASSSLYKTASPLNAVMFRKIRGGAILRIFNGEAWLSRFVPTTGEDFSPFACHVQELYKLIKSFSGDEVNLTPGEALYVEGEGVKIDLPLVKTGALVLPPGGMPKTWQPFSFSPSILKALENSCSKNKARPQYNGLSIQVRGGDLHAATTDRAQFLHVVTPTQHPEISVVVPGEVLITLSKLSGPEEIFFAAHNKNVVFRKGKNILLSKLLNVEFPYYSELLDFDSMIFRPLTLANFLTSAKQASINDTRPFHSFFLGFSSYLRTCKGNIAVPYSTDKPFQTGFDLKLLSKGLEKLQKAGAKEIEICFAGKLQPLFIRAENMTYLLMPVAS